MPSDPRNGSILVCMNIKCDNCGETGKGYYRSFDLEENGKTKWVTWCRECLGAPASGKTDKQRWEEINTPFWKLMGQKPKAKDIKLDKYLKNRGMTYGDWRRERDLKQAKYESAVSKFNEHYKKYGTRNEPNAPVYERSQEDRRAGR